MEIHVKKFIDFHVISFTGFNFNFIVLMGYGTQNVTSKVAHMVNETKRCESSVRRNFEFR